MNPSLLTSGRSAPSHRFPVLPLFVLCLAALHGLGATAEVGGQRIALVVGNAAYTGTVPPLRNPVNDARLMATTLRELDFQVTLVTNADEGALEDAVEAFGELLRGKGGGGVALFYYAGHGVQSNGVNYLVPVGARVSREGQLKSRTVPAQWVLDEMEAARTELNIVVLDACRNNPFAAAGRSVGGSRGLTRMDAPAGSFFLAYSAAAGQVAEDGDGANSIYTTALAAAMRKPGLQLEDVFKEAGREVRTRTQDAQVPWREGSWDGRFYFRNTSPPPAIGVGAPDPEAEMWLQIRETTDAGLLERFLARYPNGRYGGAAQARLEALRQEPFTVVAQPSQARVRILNIQQGYRAGMRLPAGEYQVEAGADGYQTKVERVMHGAGPTMHRITLRKTGPRAGDRFRDCPECPEMVVVPAGSYRMGSPSHEQGRQNDEGPVHEVTIGAPFALGVYEVTFAEWDACARVGGCPRGEGIAEDRGWGRGRRPVINVSWNDAQAYAIWLSRKTGKRYRLPSESEWEYAARAGTATAYSWGAHIGVNLANCDGCGSRWDDDRTAPAGSFAANPWGLHDMHGNVWEWTQDCSNDNYQRAPADGSAWESGDCARRVLRGGSWNYSPSYLRAANRIRNTSGDRLINIGFRVARTLAP